MAMLTTLIILTVICSYSKSSATAGSGDQYKYGGLCIGDSDFSNEQNFSWYPVRVKSLLSELGSAADNTQLDFYSTTHGEVPNKPYGSYLCRGDLKPQLCRECVHKVIDNLISEVGIHGECYGLGGIGLDAADYCMVHYANHSIKSTDIFMDFLVSNQGLGPKGYIDQQYKNTLSTTFEGLIREANIGNWSKPNFETRVVEVNGSNEKIYTLVQCTPDLTPRNCSKCLERSFYNKASRNGTKGGLVIHAHCLMKYNNQSFYLSASRCIMPNYLHVFFVLVLCISFLFK